ncbi:uncharacterized protein A4U43_C06F6050 [Asparagus officinalis]|uniref:Uncharacterized protein n=1 Tax=Asparagus officinalis TaxID=4686 RepID=A0A5P1EJW4_ASPOF|nr:uncharacterized protein A4U43_C06F6050 [Asparagus officinalis]
MSSRGDLDNDGSEMDEERDENFKNETENNHGSYIGFNPCIEELEMLLEAYFMQIDGQSHDLSPPTKSLILKISSSRSGDFDSIAIASAKSRTRIADPRQDSVRVEIGYRGKVREDPIAKEALAGKVDANGESDASNPPLDLVF